jgi:hypothetical protein
MKTIKESILGSTNSGKNRVKKDLAIKLAKQHKNAKHVEEKGDEIIRYDVYGQELNIGDLVFNKASFYTCIIEVCIITEFPPISKKKNSFGYDVMLYNPYHDQEVVGNILELVKVHDPEKYIV